MNLDQVVLQVSSDLINSPWWDMPDSPAMDRIKEAYQHINDGPTYAEFKKTEAGNYLLGALEEYEYAFNDADWLPFEIVGLKLDSARQFIRHIYAEVKEHGASGSISNLRQHYSNLSKP